MTDDELRKVFLDAANEEADHWTAVTIFDADIDEADDACIDAGIAAVIKTLEQEKRDG